MNIQEVSLTTICEANFSFSRYIFNDLIFDFSTLRKIFYEKTNS
jgi:hypothetical protein